MENNFRELKINRNDFELLLEQSRKEKKLTDVQLQIGDKLFDAHRVILSVYSPVLEAAISDQWSTTKICLISEEYVDPGIVEDLLSFLYTGSIQLTPDNVHPVCMAAHFLQIPTLLEPSVEFLCELISVENVLKLFLFSISCQLDLIRNSCLRFFIADHEKVLQDPEILEFRFEHFENLLLGLKTRFWGTSLREHTFHCIVRWTEKNLPKRLEHLPILLKNIPLVELPVEFLEQTVSTHPLVKECFSGSGTLSKAITNNETSWKTKENFVVIGGQRKGSKTHSRSMYCYNWTDGSWKRLPDISEHKCHFAVTVVNGRDIIISGGWVSPRLTGKVEMFDWLTQSWMELPEMPVQLSEHAMAAHDGHLYVVGGHQYNYRDSEKVPLCYSMEEKEWKFSKFNDSYRCFDQLISFKNHLYGFNSGRLQWYDHLQDEWKESERSSEQFSRIVPATVHLDKIYACSWNGFEVYDPETDSWESLPVVRYTTALVSVNGKLLAVGGSLSRCEDNTQTDLIYEFNLETKKWVEFGKLPVKLTDHQCVVGKFY